MNCDLSSTDATCPRCGFVSKVRGAIRQCRRPAPRHCGTGCHLARLLSWFGLRDDGTCGCAAYSAQMDAWGPDECERREDEIVGHLAQAAVKRGLPFVPLAARLLIRQAVANARKEAASPAESDAAGGH